MNEDKKTGCEAFNRIVAPPYEPTVEDIVRNAKGQLTKGHSGNLKGMPPGTPSAVRELRKKLIAHPELLDKIIDAWLKLAMMGDMRATEQILERLDGKVAEKHLIEGEHPITIQFVPAQRLVETKPLPQLEEGKEE